MRRRALLALAVALLGAACGVKAPPRPPLPAPPAGEPAKAPGVKP